MKKIYKALVVAMIAAVAGTIVFIGCRKENKSIIELSNSYSNYVIIDSSLFNTDYLSYVESISGIDIFNLTQEPFFMDYFNHLTNINSYFINNVRYNPTYLDTFDYWLQTLIFASAWDDEEDSVITDDHHKFYVAAEHLSIMYFGKTQLDEFILGENTYRLALNFLNSINDFQTIFGQNLFEKYPHFYNLPEDLQDLVLRIAIIIATYQENCGCGKEHKIRKSCESELEAALNDALAKYESEYNKCRNKGKHSKCVQSAAARYEIARVEAYNAYNQCVNGINE